MYSRSWAVLKAMIFTGTILLPTVLPHATQDLADLKTVIRSTAATIDAAPNNSSWGFFSPASPAGLLASNLNLGTADLITNISTTILRAKYLLDVNKIAWTTIPPNITTPDATTISISTESSLSPASALAPPSNASLDGPYQDYVSSIPTLANALIHLGRSWHKELNSPVAEAIGALQQILTQFSSSMLEGGLIGSQSILRTIRASATLESAQVAWNRALNLPAATTKKRDMEMKWPQLGEGRFYSHKDLWGRQREGRWRHEKEPSDWTEHSSSRALSDEATWSEWRLEKIGKRFVA